MANCVKLKCLNSNHNSKPQIRDSIQKHQSVEAGFIAFEISKLYLFLIYFDANCMGHAVKLLRGCCIYCISHSLSPEILGLTKWGHWLIQSHCNSGLREQWIEPPTLQWVWGQFNSASHIIPPFYSHIRDTVLQFVI